MHDNRQVSIAKRIPAANGLSAAESGLSCVLVSLQTRSLKCRAGSCWKSELQDIGRIVSDAANQSVGMASI